MSDYNLAKNEIFGVVHDLRRYADATGSREVMVTVTTTENVVMEEILRIDPEGNLIDAATRIFAVYAMAGDLLP